MAKPIVLTHGEATLTFQSTKLERSKVYGSKKRIAMDAKGGICTKAAISNDGTQIIVSGMTSQGYFTVGGRWVQRNEMVGVSSDGAIVDVKPSTLGVPQVLDGPVDPSKILELKVESVYWLESEDIPDLLARKLEQGEVYQFPINYVAGLEIEEAYLVGNDQGFFAITGKPAILNWIEEAQIFVPEQTDEDLDDLDFDSF